MPDGSDKTCMLNKFATECCKFFSRVIFQGTKKLSEDFYHSVCCNRFMTACNKYKSFAYVVCIEKDDLTSKQKASAIFLNVLKRTQNK